MSWDDGLIGPALQVAGNRNSPLRIVAGPGTGKTFALMRRATRLVEEGADPRRTLVCTFTRTAADDLSREISRLRVRGATNIVAGTLHAFCFRFLAGEDVFSDTGRFPRPLLDYETRFMLEDLKQQGLGGIRACRKRLDAFNAAWARLQSEEPGWPQGANDIRFHRILTDWLVFHRCMLVGELIPEAYHYLRNNPNCPERTAFDHVLVDEYQDLNKAEQKILDLLADNGTLTVIGDEDQSIYSFKHAHPEGISEFSQYHNNTYDETLLECRRCPQLVVNIANDLISHNLSRSPRTLTCLDGNPQGEVHIVQWNSLQEEAEGIAQFVKDRVNSGQVDPGKVLILAPRRQLGYAVRDALNNLGTSSHSFFKEEVFELDLERVKALYIMRGYSDVKIDPQLDYNPDQKKMYITLLTDEGEQYKVGTIRILGNHLFTKEDILKVLKMKEEDIFNQLSLEEDSASISSLYFDKGYIFANISPRAIFNEKTEKIDITYNIAEGELAYIDKVIIKGNDKTKDVVIRRELRFAPGEPFDGKKLQRSKERIYNLGYAILQ